MRSVRIALVVLVAFACAPPSLAGWRPSTASGSLKRSIININIPGSIYSEYMFIDHLKYFATTPIGTAWGTGTIWNTDILDANGWPKIQTNSSRPWGGAFPIPAAADFAGPYILTDAGTGRGQVAFTIGATWTRDPSSVNCTQAVAGNYNVTPGFRCVLYYTGPQSTALGWRVNSNDPNGAAEYIKNLQFYRLEDEPDLLAGKILRRGYKQPLVDLNPSAIRFMNWTGGNSAFASRFEYRNTPNVNYVANSWSVSPPYGETTGTNQYSLAAVTGTAASMVNGEIAVFRVGSSVVRTGSKTITAITKAATPTVSATTHGFQTGDRIIFVIAAGMTQLNLRPATVTVIDPNSFSIDIDTSAFSTFTAGTVNVYITMQVGSGNDRVSYPIVFPIGPNNIGGSTTGNCSNLLYFCATGYYSLVFKPEMIASTEVNGAWLYKEASNTGYPTGVPIEVIGALVRELNAMSTRGPIHVWITVPHLTPLSVDTNYSAVSNYAIGQIDVLLNGRVGWPALPSNVMIFTEFSNETWNFGGAAFSQAYYLAYLGFLRYANSTTDSSSYSTIRSVIAVNDIKTWFPDKLHRLKFVLAGQGTVGMSAGNTARINGTAQYNADPWNVWSPAEPISHFDYFAWAAYVFAPAAFESANLATLVAQYVAATTDAAREAACASYVVGIVGSGTGETISRYRDTLLPAYVSGLAAKSRGTGMYEGGWDRLVSASDSTGTATSGSAQITGLSSGIVSGVAVGSYAIGIGIPQYATVISKGTTDVTLSVNVTYTGSVRTFFYSQTDYFLRACKRSVAWSTAWLTMFNAFNAPVNAWLPADYIELDVRWGHAYIDTYANGVEGANLDLSWSTMGSRNQMTLP